MKRYQNPDIFEHLAMSYALGTLRGKACARFESLMKRRLYLRAITDSYQQTFAPLAELLPPETPPPRVWQAISRRITQQQRNTQPSRWSWMTWATASFASVVASLLTVMVLQQQPTQPQAYMATLKSPHQPDKMLVAMVKRSEMALSVEMPDATLPVEDHMTPVLWCIPKDTNALPMRMGDVTHAHSMPIDKKTWKDMKQIKELAISLEPTGTNAATPQGKIVFNGKLAEL